MLHCCARGLGGDEAARARQAIALCEDEDPLVRFSALHSLAALEIPVLARAMSRETVANMASFDTDYVINPFARFGEQLALAIAAPANYRLVSWLTGLPGRMPGQTRSGA